jgi:hypothetical protein
MGAGSCPCSMPQSSFFSFIPTSCVITLSSSGAGSIKHNNRQNVNICIKTSIPTKRERKQLNVSERKVCRRILGPVYDNEKENWTLLTNKEVYTIVKKSTTSETIRLHRLCWFGYEQSMEENSIPKSVLYVNWKQQD